jgi:hypothetical protein
MVMAIKEKKSVRIRAASTRSSKSPGSRTAKVRAKELLTPASLDFLIAESPIHPAARHSSGAPPFEPQDD